MEGLTQDCLNAIEGRLIQGHISSPFQGVSINSRTVSKGDLFVCIKGDRFDGHDFLADVIDKKVGGVILSNPKKLPNVPVQDQAQPFLIHVSDTLKALQDLACFQRNRFPFKFFLLQQLHALPPTQFVKHSFFSSIRIHIIILQK